MNSEWLAGAKPTSADKEALAKLAYAPNPDTHPHTFGWWSIVRMFTPDVTKTWPTPAPSASKSVQPAKAGKADTNKSGKQEKNAKPKKEEKPAGGDDDEDFDPFAEDDDTGD